MKTHIGFDMEAAIKDLCEGKDLSSKDGIFTPLIKQLTEAVMQAELEEHLAAEADSNRKNGSSTKTMITPTGEFELKIPHDRPGMSATSKPSIRLSGWILSITKSRKNESSWLKLLYAGILNASKRWTHPVQNGNLTLSQ